MMNKFLIIIAMMFTFGCASPQSNTHQFVDDLKQPTPHPIAPEWVTFTRKPVLKGFTVEGNTNFEVSDEFMKRTLQMHDYTNRITKWKRKNLIP